MTLLLIFTYIVLIVCVVCAVWMINIVLNLLAYDWINARRNNITAALYSVGLDFYDSDNNVNDTAPCQCTYGIVWSGLPRTKQLPARKIKRLLDKLQQKKLTTLQVVEYVEKHGKLMHQPPPTYTL